jgi:TonB family protein
MKIFLFALTPLVFCFAAGFAQEKSAAQPFEFRGTLKDKNASVFAGTSLFFKTGDKETSVVTDINGDFKIPLSPGNYEATVRKTLSETFKAYIFIQEKGLNPNNVEFVIEANPVCCGDLSEKPYPKITKLPKPPYPAAALAVRAGGEVVVEVKIDKEGKVVAANVVSGHPLLKQASLFAARQSLFEADETDEQREVNLTYVFFLPGQTEKPNINRYTNPYRVDVIGIAVSLDTTPSNIY